MTTKFMFSAIACLALAACSKPGTSDLSNEYLQANRAPELAGCKVFKVTPGGENNPVIYIARCASAPATTTTQVGSKGSTKSTIVVDDVAADVLPVKGDAAIKQAVIINGEVYEKK